MALQQNSSAGQGFNGIQNEICWMGFIDYKNFLYVKNHIAEQHRVTLSSKIDFEKLIYKLREDP